MPSTNKNKRLVVTLLETVQRSSAALGAIGFVALSAYTVPPMLAADKAYDKLFDAGCNTDTLTTKSQECQDLGAKFHGIESKEQERGSAAILFGIANGAIAYGATQLLKRVREVEPATTEPQTNGPTDGISTLYSDAYFKSWERVWQNDSSAEQ